MELLRFSHSVEYLVYAIAVALLPDEATAEADAAVIKAPIYAVPYRWIDFLSLEMVLLGGLVLLALVLIARRPATR
jgi:hypothetical protein